MSVLQKICDDKREHVATCKGKLPQAALEGRIKTAPPVRGFIKGLRAQNPGLIAEIKKASPSVGVIREDFNPAELAKAYKAGGAACLSILTDEPYFQGKTEYLLQGRAACDLPVLRKDFIVDPYQVYETRAMGADCMLIIMAAIEDTLVKDLYDLATELKLDTLFEVHDREELDRALKLNPGMVGVNNRNLKTLKVDIDTALEIASALPADLLRVAESGIHGNDDLKRLQTAGFTAFLVGESLMRQPNVTAATKALLGIS
ncbi:MAG: indole-3-glycerol phosphate synthase TrpC [Micavibrio aeruginosavorus]|uniref:Indole-3-glycerol phosphate synthase n=1 Tax=Micavibrio aeruginosavorus TaxID=349221 RepID=A0A7T5R0Q4_9BACT|nr:MAG: indole-3-glycerol phosphate synthase TrpC [Micavibrio aeruginosavorus]